MDTWNLMLEASQARVRSTRERALDLIRSKQFYGSPLQSVALVPVGRALRLV
jgi:hypothetical protein